MINLKRAKGKKKCRGYSRVFDKKCRVPKHFLSKSEILLTKKNCDKYHQTNILFV
ncbi:hypothetical protein Hanom_Chr02g00169191 [Helianthus anomalus]